MALPPKVCPECGEEYLHSASFCVHCEVPLVHGGEAGARRGGELPPISQLQRIRAASAGWAVSLSERLREARIPHRVEPLEGEPEAQPRPGWEPPFGVYVRPEDVAAARRVDAEHLAAQVPDLPEGFDPGGFDAPMTADDACPACGEPVDPADSECRGCGIALGEPE